jgi:malonyl-CoA/methylmalonyl-CoA synthetase
LVLRREALNAWLSGVPRLARYKVPKRVLLVEELPRNTMGKVQKNALRAAYAALYEAK